MKIIELLEPKSVLPDMIGSTKLAVLEELASTLVPGTEGLDLDTVVEVLMERAFELGKKRLLKNGEG